MDPLTAGIISAGANTIGGLFQNQNSRANADHAFNQSLEASNTAHQREVKDLRAAGLNPILSALGSGASTPGATASESSNLGEGISTGISTGMAVKQANKEWELKDQTIDNMRDESFNIIENRKKIQSEVQNIKANGDLIRMQTKVAREMLPYALKSKSRRRLVPCKSTYGRDKRSNQ